MEVLSPKNLKKLNSKKGLLALLSKEPINIERAIRYVDYQKKLVQLQAELIRLQTWAINCRSYELSGKYHC